MAKTFNLKEEDYIEADIIFTDEQLEEIKAKMRVCREYEIEWL